MDALLAHARLAPLRVAAGADRRRRRGRRPRPGDGPTTGEDDDVRATMERPEADMAAVRRMPAPAAAAPPHGERRADAAAPDEEGRLPRAEARRRRSRGRSDRRAAAAGSRSTASWRANGQRDRGRADMAQGRRAEPGRRAAEHSVAPAGRRCACSRCPSTRAGYEGPAHRLPRDRLLEPGGVRPTRRRQGDASRSRSPTR